MAKSILSRIFTSQPKWRPSAPIDGSRLPEVGEIFSFKTQPYSEFAPEETGRFGAFKVIGRDSRLICIAVSDAVWLNAPIISEVILTSILREDRAIWVWGGKICAFGINKDWWDFTTLCEMTTLGIVDLSEEEIEFARRILNFEVGTSTSTLHYANFSVEGEWRWKHDRDAFAVEAELNQAKNEAERKAKELRFKTRLKALTFKQLQSETFFVSWEPSPPYPPMAFIEEARIMLREACIELQAMGEKPPRAKVRAVIRRSVEWFNTADERFGEVIETEERESICLALEEICYAARQKGLVDEIDNWRNW